MIYLARNGKVSGPFTEKEFQDLHAKNALDPFRWIWKENQKTWVSLDPPPKASPQALLESQKQKTQEIEALCFDHSQVVPGFLRSVTEAGCEFLTSAGLDEGLSPPFTGKKNIRIHLFELTSEKSLNYSSEIYSIERQNQHWVYRLHWRELPEILR